MYETILDRIIEARALFEQRTGQIAHNLYLGHDDYVELRVSIEAMWAIVGINRPSGAMREQAAGMFIYKVDAEKHLEVS